MSLCIPSDICPHSIGWQYERGESVGKDLVPVAIEPCMLGYLTSDTPSMI